MYKSLLMTVLYLASTGVSLKQIMTICCNVAKLKVLNRVLTNWRLGKRARCFALFVFLVSLPHDATGLSAVCDSGISCSYSLSIFVSHKIPYFGQVLTSNGLTPTRRKLSKTCCHLHQSLNFRQLYIIWKTDPSEIERTYNIRKQQTQVY